MAAPLLAPSSVAACVLAYLAGHLALYRVVLRERPVFAGERAIFCYHAVSFVLAVVASLALVAAGSGPDGPALAVATLAAHGIYSLSFLEMWSLAEGGYSLAILERARDAEERGGELDRTALVDLGRFKRDARLAALLARGLVARDGERLTLTVRGRALAAAMGAIAAMARSSPRGRAWD